MVSAGHHLPQLVPLILTAMTQPAAISILPDDLLESIFLTCVHGDTSISPLVLSHVSLRWRTVALTSARVWTRVDMSSSQRARHYVSLTQQAPLRVSWTGSHHTPYAVETKRDWIWQYSRRFEALDLHDTRSKVEQVLRHQGRSLQNLTSLSIVVMGSLQTSVLQRARGLKFPKLTSLFLG